MRCNVMLFLVLLNDLWNTLKLSIKLKFLKTLKPRECYQIKPIANLACTSCRLAGRNENEKGKVGFFSDCKRTIV